jgi:hypothetical protein
MNVDTSDLVTTRRNLLALSLLVIFYAISGAEIEDGSVFGNTFKIQESRMSYIWAYVFSIQTYLIWRFEALRPRLEFWQVLALGAIHHPRRLGWAARKTLRKLSGQCGVSLYSRARPQAPI